MRVWVTRTRPAALTTAERLRGTGFDPLVDPLLETRRLSPAFDLADIGALAFTSRNGVEAFAALTPDRGLAAFAVGEATAEAARAAGFAVAAVAGGGVEALAALVAGSPPPKTLLVPGPVQPAGDLPGLLQARGVPARALPVYATAPRPPVEAFAAFAEGAIGAILLQSARAAEALAALERDDGLDLKGATIVCASPAIAAALGRRRAVRVAERPDEPALIAALASRGEAAT